jgi:hypothetical protein
MIDRLSLDIFCQIFEYYAEDETIEHPLETLLLVSRTWNNAACTHRSLWGRLKIFLYHNPDFEAWEARLPLRLQRSGPTAPLHIHIRNLWGTDMPRAYRYCGCYEHKFSCRRKAYQYGIIFLRILAGPNGEQCKRWTTLRLELGLNDHRSVTEDASPFSSLFYPTPSLVKLEIYSTRIDGSCQILPSCPSLTRVSLYDCYTPHLPDIHNCRNVTIEWNIGPLIMRLGDLSSLERARNIEELTIKTPIRQIELKVPGILPRLTTLSLSGCHPPINLPSVVMPNLRKLILQPLIFRSIPLLLACEGIPFSQIKMLELCPYRRFDQLALQHVETLLRSTTSLTNIHADVQFMLPLIGLLQLGDNDLSNQLFSDSEIVISCQKGSRKIPSGIEERRATIDSLKMDWDLNA